MKEPRTLANLSFPVGRSARYTGETIAEQDTVIFTGTARVDVSWGTPDDINAATVLGTMSLTISDIASAEGDALSQGGSDTDGSEAPRSKIADVVFPGIPIIVGGQGDFPNNMIAGTAGTADGDGDIPHGEARVTGGRYRLITAGTDVAATGTASAIALFVGQGVDGPLGVIGRWTLDDDTVGRVRGDGTSVDDRGQAVCGAFCVESP